MTNLRNIFLYYRLKIAQRITKRRIAHELRDPGKLDRRKLAGEELMFFSDLQSIPQAVSRALVAAFGESYLGEMQDLFKNRSMQLSVLMVAENLGSIVWVGCGANIPHWLVPLSDDDFVLSRGFTASAFRGRGLHARCIAFAYDTTAAPSSRFFAASLRQLKRSGFEIVV